MRRRALLPTAVAALGVCAVVIGIDSQLLVTRATHDGTITTGWGGAPSHEERLLVRTSVVGLAGALATLRWRRLAVVPAAAGGLVLVYALRATVHRVGQSDLYTGLPVAGGTTGRFVLGAEPYALAAGAILLVAAAVGGYATGSSGVADTVSVALDR